MRSRPDNRSFQIELQMQRLLPRGRNQSNATQDYLQQYSQHMLDPAQGFRLVEGIVVDTTAYVHNYKVSLTAGLGVFRGVLLSHSSGGLLGARASNTLPVGARVLCCVFEGAEEAFILGVVPDSLVDAADAASDFVVPGSRTGFNVDAYLQGPYLLPKPVDGEPELDACGAADYSAGRPFDGLTSGESGFYSETGGGLHLDQMMAFLRINEETGVFGFYHDSLLRVSGRNLQLSSGVYEREDADDQSYLYSEEGYAWHTWETLGTSNENLTDLSREFTPQESQIDSPWYHVLEPKFDNQQPYWRFRRWSGWLAGGQKEQLTYPATEINSQALRYEDLVDGYGLYSAQTLATGRAFWESAKGLTLGKRAYIPVPKRLRPTLTDPGHPESYTELFDGLKIPPGLQEPSSVLRAADYIEQHTYSSNFEGYYPFLDLEAYTAKEESDLVTSLGLNEAPAYTELETLFFLEPPAPVSVQLHSDRYSQMKIFPNNAFLHFTEDGGIVLTDGWGSEIRMTSGHIYLAAAGDIVMQSGRSITALAGHDFVARAHNSADISAANRDVRLKAQVNCMIMGGNDVCGGVLIESRTPGVKYDFSQPGEDALVTGIVLKTENGQISQIGKEILFFSDTVNFAGACTGGSGSSSSPRQIIFDAGDSGRIGMYAKLYDRHILGGGEAVDIFQNTSGDTTGVVNEYRKDFTLLGAPLLVGGCIYADGSISTEEWFLARNGTLAVHETDFIGRGTQEMDPLSLTQLDEAITALRLRSDTTLPAFVGQLDRRAEYTVSGDDVCAAEFTFRTSPQYHTEESVHYETRWQQRARLGSQTLPIWNEPLVVSASGSATAPYPGKDRWFDDDTGRQITPSVYDESRGLAADRNGPYTSGFYAAPQAVNLSATYTVIIET